MNDTQKLRWKFLLGKKTLTADDKTELKALRALGAVHKLTDSIVKTFLGKTNDDPNKGSKGSKKGSMSRKEVKSLLKTAVGEELKAKGLVKEDLLKDIESTILANGGKSLTKKDVSKVFAKHLEDVDGGEALLKQVTKAITASQGVTKSEVEKILKKHLRKESKMVHGKAHNETAAISHPVTHRSGNMTVASKQLLNICLGGVSNSALQSSGSKGISRPVGMNEGISEKQLSNAKTAGLQNAESVRQSMIYGEKAPLLTGAAGQGRELVPSDLAGELLARFYLESRLAAEFVRQEINMPTPTFTLPIGTTNTEFFGISEAGAAVEDTPSTAEIVLAARKFMGKAQYSYESDEDSIIAVLPMLQERMSRGAAISWEHALINGDTSSTHQDSDIAGVSKHAAKQIDGFRKLSLAQTELKVSLATGGLTASAVHQVIKALGQYGMNPEDLLIVMGVRGYGTAVEFDETLTADKVGNDRARILTGTAPTLWGSRIVPSVAVRENLNASGVYDGTTTTKGSFHVVHRPSWLIGNYRAFTVETDRNINTQMNDVVASFRRTMSPQETPSAAIPIVATGYNYNA